MKRLHILLVHQSFILPGESGGTRHYEFASRWVKAGDRVTVIAPMHALFTGERLPQPASDVSGITVVRVRSSHTQSNSFVARVWSFLGFAASSFVAAMRVKDVDVVLGTTPPIFQACSAALAAFLRRKPFVLEIRDLWPEFAIALGVFRNPLLVWMAHCLERFLYRSADHIIVNSPAYKGYLIEKRSLAAERITCVPNGVDGSMFASASDGASFRERFALRDRFVVTYAGAMGIANGLESLIEVAEKLKSRSDVCLLLVGDGRERAKLEAMARGRGLQNLIFAGPQPKNLMPAVLAASDACIAILKNIPMFTTTYPNKVFDYMAAGKPTVLAIDGAIREVMEAAGGGIFCPPEDADAVAAAIVRLADDREGARRMGAAAREYVQRHFDRDEHAREFGEILIAVATNGDVAKAHKAIV